MASTLGAYQVRLKNQKGEVVAVFDSWSKLSYVREVNGVSSYQLVIDGNDSRAQYFEIDGQIEVWRSVPGLQKDWYIDFEGFHRKEERMTTKDGQRLFVSSGVGYNDLLARTVIGYKEGTIRAEKRAPAETVMKEYVKENCIISGGDATAVGRLNYDEHLDSPYGGLVYDSGLPGLSMQTDTYSGVIWEGERAYENLLSTLQDIASTTGMDFNIVGTGPAQFEFRTYKNGIGPDQRYINIDSLTGKNDAGNQPMMFSVPFGTVQEITYTNDRTSEANCVMVLGEGQLSLREVYTVADQEAIAVSPWNRREITRPGSNQDYDYQFRQIGFEALKENAAKVSVDFDPLQTETHCYGVTYFFGSKVTSVYDGIYLHKKIAKVSVNVEGIKETISIEFSE